MSKHRTQSGYTPGKWSLNVGEDWDGANVTDKHGRTVALCEGCDMPGSSVEVGTEEAKSNARLIAASPTMLAALERVSEWFKQHGTAETQGIACDVFQAIDAAKGNP